MKKSDIQKMNSKEKNAKIAELERAVLELMGEGRFEKVKPLKKAIAALKTKKD
ncbi:hypothetical protein JXA56_02825 [Candidatus Micrarchaeota archaeon]|nr:hypothetical protein [Candidatus Micrarchaeota archaeon]